MAWIPIKLNYNHIFISFPPFYSKKQQYRPENILQNLSTTSTEKRKSKDVRSGHYIARQKNTTGIIGMSLSIYTEGQE